MRVILRYWWLIAIILIFLKLKSKKPMVKYGDKSEDVKNLQNWINDMCCYEKIDGIFGKNTSISLASILEQLKFDYNIDLNNTDVLKYHQIDSYLAVYSVDLDWLNSLRKYGSIN